MSMNITEHSESDRGYIFAQAYPTKGFLDVCIADRGVSLLGSYEKLPDNEILSDMEAIKAANRGLSSKNLPDAENRGFGIRTSKQMLIHGLGGQYLMISGFPEAELQNVHELDHDMEVQLKQLCDHFPDKPFIRPEGIKDYVVERIKASRS